MTVRVAILYTRDGKKLRDIVETDAEDPRLVARWARQQEGVDRTRTEGNKVLVVMKEEA